MANKNQPMNHNQLRNKIIRLLPALIWMAFIFYLSSLQTTGITGTKSQRFLILKTFHLIEYAVLVIFLFFALKKYLPSSIAAYVFALTDELHQTTVPGREGKFEDTLIDILGIIIGLVILKIFLKIPKVKKIFSL